jgi:Flp pilus assembly pilin Flp
MRLLGSSGRGSARRRRGAAAIEYALVAGLIALLLGAASHAGTHLSVMMAYIADRMAKVPPVDPTSIP